MDTVLSTISSHKEKFKMTVELKKVSGELRNSLLEALKSGGTYSSFVPFFEAFDEWASDKTPSMQKGMLFDVVKAAYYDMLDFLNMSPEDMKLYELAMQIYDGYVEYRLEKDTSIRDYILRATTLTVITTALISLYVSEKLRNSLKGAARDGASRLILLWYRLTKKELKDLVDMIRAVVSRGPRYEYSLLAVWDRISKMSQDERGAAADVFVGEVEAALDKSRNLPTGSMSWFQKLGPHPYVNNLLSQEQIASRDETYKKIHVSRICVIMCEHSNAKIKMSVILKPFLKEYTSSVGVDTWFSNFQTKALSSTRVIIDATINAYNFTKSSNVSKIYLIDHDQKTPKEQNDDTSLVYQIGFSENLDEMIIRHLLGATYTYYTLSRSDAIKYIISIVFSTKFQDVTVISDMEDLVWECIVNSQAAVTDYTTFDGNAFQLYLALKNKEMSKTTPYKGEKAIQRWLAEKIFKASEEFLKEEDLSTTDKKTITQIKENNTIRSI